MVHTKAVISHTARLLLTNEKIRTLLIHSESAKQHDYLNVFALNFKKARAELVDNEIESWSDEAILLTNDLLDRIVNSCRDEWKGSITPFKIILEDKKRVPCQLCGQAGLKELFYIENKLNSTKLIVGSRCIEEFPNLEFPGKKSIKQIKKEMQEQSRLKEISLAIPGIEKEISQWKNELDKFDILIPSTLEEKYIELGKNITSLFRQYLTGKVSKRVFPDIQLAKIEKEKLLLDMKMYNESNKNKNFVVTKKIIYWLKQKNKHEVIDTLKITGFIDELSIHEIIEPEFSEKMSFYFAEKLKHIGKLFYSKDKNEYILNLYKFDVKLYFRIDRFMEHYGKALLGKETKIPLTEFNIFTIGKIKDQKSKRNTLFQISRMLNRFDIQISFEDYGGRYDHFEQNVIDLYDKRINKILEDDLDYFIDRYKAQAFLKKNDRLKDEIIKYIDNHPKKRTMRTKDELREIRFSRFKDSTKKERETD